MDFGGGEAGGALRVTGPPFGGAGALPFDVVAAGPASYVNVKYFDKTSALLCYGKDSMTEDNVQSRTASCVVVQDAVSNGAYCRYGLPGYTCPLQYCEGGLWGSEVRCINSALANASAEVLLGVPLIIWVLLFIALVMGVLFVTYSFYDEAEGTDDLETVEGRVNEIELDWEERHLTGEGTKSQTAAQAQAAMA